MMDDISFLWLTIKQWELIYYVAFILLTVLIVVYAIKTYWFQSKLHSELICKCVESGAGKGNGRILFEVYNHGNAVARDIQITIQKRSYGTIPFLKPEESFYIPLGYSIGVDKKKSLISFAEGVRLSENTLTAQITASKKAPMEYSIDISMLKSAPIQQEQTVKELENIVAGLKEIRKETAEIAKNIKSKK